ncbi:MAG: phosphotransferase, partial [Chlorobiaceae bacterium]|nr:phosphotransferase [Chlorobiaceae bacterium]
LVSLQSVAGSSDQIPFSLSFDQEKLMFEFDFFIEHAVLNYFSGTMPAPSVALLRKEFAGIAQLLVRPEHFVLNHRDFHSRNILLYHDTPYLIDFQDARMGLPQYDAVSLLRDSYITLDDSVAEELKRYHYDALVRGGLIMMSFDEYLFLFDVMAFQRNIKALGTFCYQTAVLGKPQYEVSIAPTLAYLSAYIARRKELEQAGTLLLPLLEGDRS